MTLVLIGKDLVLEGSRLKIEDKQVPGTTDLKKKHWSGAPDGLKHWASDQTNPHPPTHTPQARNT